MNITLSNVQQLNITTCNHNYSKDGIFHPDRILPEYDLLYLSEGEWEIWEETTCFHIKKDQVLILEPGRHHFSIDRCTPGMRNMYIHFSDGQPETLGQAVSESSLTEQFHCEQNLPELSLSKLTDCAGRYQVKHLFEEVIETFWSSGSTSRELRLSSLLSLILCELADLDTQQLQPADVLIQEITHRFYTSLDRFYSPAELAEDYGISLRSLSQRFRKATGQSIHQYQLHLKLVTAYDLLPTNPGRSLRDIAVSMGFYDEFQFSKLFKRQFGISPSQRRDASPAVRTTP